jgi:hypothetical protein
MDDMQELNAEGVADATNGGDIAWVLQVLQDDPQPKLPFAGDFFHPTQPFIRHCQFPITSLRFSCRF